MVIILLASFLQHTAISDQQAIWWGNLQWTTGCIAGAVLAWLGVRWADNNPRTSRKWFAVAMSVSRGGQLLMDP